MEEKERIKVIVKPESVSWDDIHNVIWAAHKKNRDRGIFMRYPSLTGEQLKEKVGDGCCIVAMHGNSIVGTCSFKIIQRNEWYAPKKKVAYYLLEGVLPQFQGMGIYSKMISIRERLVREKQIEIVEMDTAEKNKEVQVINLKNGFRYVKFNSFSYGKHYSVVMAKWLNGCSLSSSYCALRFYLSKIETKLRYKPGRVERSHVLSRIINTIKKVFF